MGPATRGSFRGTGVSVRIELGMGTLTKEEDGIVKRPTRPIRLAPPTDEKRCDLAGNPVDNLVLSSLPDQEYQLLQPHLEPVQLPQYKILSEPGARIDFCYFLNAGMTSLVALSSDGRSVEVGIVGREGMVGMTLTVGLRHGIFRSIMQMSGTGLRLRSEVFQDILRSAPTLRSNLNRFALMNAIQGAQLAACNRLHETEQRLARWLLMCQDRVDSRLLPLTHEFLAQMLGTGRPSVSLAAAALENAGLIENSRGAVRILNRKNLEHAACECYGVIQNLTDRLRADHT